MFIRLFFLFCVLFFSPHSFAKEKKLFKASYVNFMIEGDWICKNFHVEWVCHHSFSDNIYPAFILIGAEEAKVWESFNFFLAFERSVVNPLLNKSYPKKFRIHKLNWVEEFGKGEFPLHIYNRWKLTTSCCEAGPRRARVFVGFQAHRNDYTKYSAIFSNAAMSLKLDKNITQLVEDIRQYGSQSPKTVDYIQQILSNVDEEDKEEIFIVKDWGFLEDKVFQFILILIPLSLLWWFLDKRKMRKIKQEKIKRRRRRRSSQSVRHRSSRDRN